MATKQEIMLELEKLGATYSVYARKAELEKILEKARQENKENYSQNSVKMLQSLLNKGKFYKENEPLKEDGIKGTKTVFAFNNAVYQLGINHYPTIREMIMILNKKLS